MNTYQKTFASLTTIKSCTAMSRKLLLSLDDSKLSFERRQGLIIDAENERKDKIRSLKEQYKSEPLNSWLAVTGLEAY